MCSKISKVAIYGRVIHEEFYPYFKQMLRDLNEREVCLTCYKPFYDFLKENNVYSRRYFYPLISDFSMYKGMKSASKENLPVANEIARKVLCLPIYPTLTKEDQERVISLVWGA